MHIQNGPAGMKGSMGLNSGRPSNSFPSARTAWNAVLVSARYIGYSDNIFLPQGIFSFANILSLRDQNTLHTLH